MDPDNLLDGYQDGFEGLEDQPLQINESRARGIAEQQEAERLSNLTEEELDEELRQNEIQQAVDEEAALPDLTVDDLPLAGIAGAVDNVLGTDIQGAYVENQNEGRAARAEGAARAEQTLTSGPAGATFAEATRAVIGGRAGLVESVGETGELALDTVSTWLGVADEESRIWNEDGSANDAYVRPNWNLGVADNKTAIGAFARNLITFHTAYKFIPGGNAVKGRNVASRVQRVQVEALRGAAADLIITDVNDGTLTQQAAKLFGIEPDNPFLGPFVRAMTVEEDDNPWKAKILGTIEGGILGETIDGAAEVLGAFRRGRKAVELLKARKTDATVEQLKKEALAKMDEYLIAKRQGSKAVEAYKRKKQLEHAEKDAAEKAAFEQGIDKDLADLKAKVESEKDYRGEQLEIDEFKTMWSERQLGLEDAGLDMTQFSARAVRKVHDEIYGSSPIRKPEYEVDEKAARLDANPDTTKAAGDYMALDDYKGDLQGRSSRALMTNAGYKKIASAVDTPAQKKALIDTVKKVGARIDVDELSRRFGDSNQATVGKAYQAVREFIGLPLDGTPEQAEQIFRDLGLAGDDLEGGGVYLSRSGVVAAKTLISDAAIQINDLANNAVDLINSGRRNPSNQFEMLVDRLRTLSRMHKQASIHYASGLQTFKLGPIKLGNNAQSVAKEMDQIDEHLDKMVKLAKRGDEQSVQELKSMTQGLVAAEGDASKIVSFGALGRRIGFGNALRMMYNSILSGPLSHARNIAGNLGTMVLRPATMALGQTLEGDFDKAAASMASLGAVMESFTEAMTVASRTWSSGVPQGGSAKFDLRTAEAARDIEAMKMAAVTDNQKRVANHLEQMYNFTNSKFMTAPTRALSAGDDFFKILNARIELKRQAYMETLSNDGLLKFDPDVYARIAKEKIDENGTILDDGLLKITKEQTFQQELQGTMLTISNTLEQNPTMKYFVPFIKTPHNLMVYSASHMPILNRFLKESQAIRDGSDQAAKAMLKGRVALGYVVLGSGMALASQGLLTGNGPADPELRKIWLRNNQPMSIKLGDKFFSYASIEPLNLVFSLAADLAQTGSYLPEGEYDRLLGQLQYTFAKAFYERSFFDGLQSAFAYLNPTQLSNVNYGRGALELVNNHIPLAGLRRQVARAIAPGIYEFRNEFERIAAQAVPGSVFAMDSQLEIDQFTGEPKINTKSPGPIFHIANQFLPFNITNSPNDPVIRQLGELMIDTSTDYGDTYQGMELSPAERGAINKIMADRGLYKALKDRLDSPRHKNDVKQWQESFKLGIAGDRRDQRWYKEITGEFARARREAARLYSQQNIDFSRRLRDHRRSKFLQSRGAYGTLQNFYKQ